MSGVASDADPSESAAAPAPATDSNTDGDIEADTPVPTGPSEVITALEMRNDLPYERKDSLAYSSIPIARARNLLSTDDLVVVATSNTGEHRVQAQLRPVARWGGTVTDETKPIKWLSIATKSTVPAAGSTHYSLRKIEGAGTLTQSEDVVVLVHGNGVTIDTGVARFEVDPTSPALFSAIQVGGAMVLGPGPGGPFVVDDAGNELTASVDETDGFSIEERGPVKVVIRSAGHFARAGATGSACASDLAYTARFTFVRNSPHINIELDLRNECGEGFAPEGAGGSWWSRFYRVRSAGWAFPSALVSAPRRLVDGNEVFVGASDDDARIEQEYGNESNLHWRRARLLSGPSVLRTAEALDRPLLAVVGPEHSVAVAQAWMHYREPCALVARGAQLRIELISSTIALGEAQAKWGFAQVRFFAGNAADALILEQRDAAIGELQRGVLVRGPVAYTNTTGVMSRLPEAATGERLLRYQALLEAVHDDTIVGWRRAKRFGLVWPDTHERNADASIDQTSAENPVSAASNYWSATSSELAEYLRNGDPRFFWDMAFPMEHNMMKTVVYNVGTRSIATRSRVGFHAGNSLHTNQREGKAYREGSNTDDYLYNQGTDDAYLLRPTGSFLEVFAQACKSALVRYPNAASLTEQMDRDEYLAQRRLQRGPMQHFNMLRYAAEFLQDPVLAAECEARLHDIVAELAVDNFFAGIGCSNDFGNTSSCDTAEHFMYSALFFDFFDAYSRQYAGSALANTVEQMLVTMAAQYYDTVAPHLENGDIDVGGQWGSALRCEFVGGELSGCINLDYEFSALADERANHSSVLLMSDARAPVPSRCGIGARALRDALSSGAFESSMTGQGFNVGWWKGASQNMRNVVFGIGVAEACAPD